MSKIRCVNVSISLMSDIIFNVNAGQSLVMTQLNSNKQCVIVRQNAAYMLYSFYKESKVLYFYI